MHDGGGSDAHPPKAEIGVEIEATSHSSRAHLMYPLPLYSGFLVGTAASAPSRGAAHADQAHGTFASGASCATRRW